MKNKLLRWMRISSSCGKLRTKLLCLYFLLIVIPLGIFSLFAYLRVRDVIQDQTFSAAQNAFDDTYLSIQRVFGQLDEVVDILSSDPLVYAMASNDPEDHSYIQRLEDSNKLATTFEQLRTLSGVKRIQLYVNNDYPYSNNRNNIIQISKVQSSAWYQRSSASGGLWCAPQDFEDQPVGEQQCFSSLQTIYNPRSVKEPLAILRADIDAGRITQLVNATSITENGLLLILRDGEVLLTSNSGSGISDLAPRVKALPTPNTKIWEQISLDDVNYYAQCLSLSSSGWYIASILPLDDIFRPSHELRSEMLCIVVAVALFAYLLAYFFSQSTLNRLFQLTKTMQTVETGNVAVRLDPVGNDEIAQLMGSFNQMMDRVDTLMEEKVEYGRQIKNLELKALQSQINPHFLYNSLDLINCTAICRNVPEISKMVKALGNFYRLSLSNGREVIPLSGELKHAQLYVEIQNMRFENRVSATWNLDPSAASCLIIKTVLQPLIENAIIHGLFEKPSKSGHLTVATHRSADGIHITIQDDGVGMDEPTRLANFFISSPGEITATDGGYGVRNIQDRLRLAYGEPYGLSCQSIPGLGTTVTVYIPAIESDNLQKGS